MRMSIFFFFGVAIIAFEDTAYFSPNWSYVEVSENVKHQPD